MSTLADDLRFAFGMTSPERLPEQDVVSEKSYDRATEAINGMATRIDQYIKRIGELERDMDAIASLYEKDVDRVGSHEMVQIAYDMRCIARSALTEKVKL